MTFLWILLAILYVACWICFGLATFRKVMMAGLRHPR